MNVLFYIVIGVYYFAINIYGIILLKLQKKMKENEEPYDETLGDGKIFLTACLGGALGILIGMFAMKYRLKSFFLMVLLPVIIAINVYILVLIFTTNNFGVIVSLTPRLA